MPVDHEYSMTILTVYSYTHMIMFYSVLIYSCVLSTLYLQQYMVSLVVVYSNTTGNPSSLSSDDPSFSFLKSDLSLQIV